MTEPKIIADFPKCPWCDCEETVTQKAWRETHQGKDKDIFVSFRKDAVPLTATSPAVTISLPVVPGLQLDRDYCLKCGRERVTRASIVSLDISALQAAMAKQIMQQRGGKSQTFRG